MIEKQAAIRSNAIRNAARGQPCTLRLPGCDGGGETTVLAHLPYGNRGIGRKANDLHGAFCCRVCHDQLDGRALLAVSREELLEAIIRAHGETLDFLARRGILGVKS